VGLHGAEQQCLSSDLRYLFYSEDEEKIETCPSKL
jgi:hypothetical protein